MNNLQNANTKSDLFFWIDAFNPVTGLWKCIRSAVSNTDAINQVEVLRDEKPACWFNGEKYSIAYRITRAQLDGNRLGKLVP